MFSTPERRPSNKKFVTPTYAPLSKRYEEAQNQERYCNAVRQNSRVTSCFDADFDFKPKTKTVFSHGGDEHSTGENNYPGNYRESRDKTKIDYTNQHTNQYMTQPEDEGFMSNRRVFGQVNDVRSNLAQAN